MALSLGACSNEDLDPKSVFDDSVSMPENDFDRWLKTNYVDEYNIQFKYRFEFNESDAGYNLTPAEYDKAVAMAKLTKYLCRGDGQHIHPHILPQTDTSCRFAAV